jgi:two-component system sensor histidine kinase GlrK
MSLMSRLLVSQFVPLLLTTIALAVVLASLARMTATLTALRATELGALEREGAVHRAAWGADVALRRGLVACQQGASDAVVSGELRTLAAPLRGLLSAGDTRGANATILEIARRYLALIDDIGVDAPCDTLRAPSVVQRRSQLDEELTEAWVARLSELHAVVQQKEQAATKLGDRAFSFGTTLAVLSLAAALFFVRRLSEMIRRPLRTLERTAGRFAEGDFGSAVIATGPMELRQLAEALEAMRRRLSEVDALKQGFLASVSHELRTPLSKIREALALLADGVAGPLTDRQRRVVELGRTACEREIRLVTTLLDLSRLRAGTPLRRQAGTHMDQVIKAAMDDEIDEANARGVEIVLDAAGDIPTAILDPALVERAIANLLRNAIAVSVRGQKVQLVRALTTHDWQGQESPSIVVRVVDEGPGVPEEIRSVIFDAFVTAAVAQSPKSIGVGLGLALAREIARVHGGELLLEDAAGARGTCFSMWLPVSTPEARQSAIARISAPAASATPSPTQSPTGDSAAEERP